MSRLSYFWKLNIWERAKWAQSQRQVRLIDRKSEYKDQWIIRRKCRRDRQREGKKWGKKKKKYRSFFSVSLIFLGENDSLLQIKWLKHIVFASDARHRLFFSSINCDRSRITNAKENSLVLYIIRARKREWEKKGRFGDRERMRAKYSRRRVAKEEATLEDEYTRHL